MMKKILVPFDGSETALRALEFAAGIGKPFGSEIMVVNVIVPYDYTKVPPRKPKNAIEEAEMAAKEPDPTPLDIAKGILDKLGCTTASYRLIVDIDPAERILEYAKTAEADMIVLGNRGMGMLAELLMGSVSMKISQYAECPVVIVNDQLIYIFPSCEGGNPLETAPYPLEVRGRSVFQNHLSVNVSFILPLRNPSRSKLTYRNPASLKASTIFRRSCGCAIFSITDSATSMRANLP